MPEDLQQRITRLEVQIERIISDIESEKETRARVNVDQSVKLERIETRQEYNREKNDERFGKLERIIFMMTGGGGVLSVVVQVLISHYGK